jgi:uncharacterized protein YciI
LRDASIEIAYRRTGDHVSQHIVVETSPQRAFRAFTEGMHRWQPRARVTPWPGGPCTEDGAVLGTVTIWEPPSRVVIARSDETVLAATFVAEGPRRTRVEAELPAAWHGALEAFAAAAIANKFLMTYETTPAGLAKAPLHIAAHIARLDEFRARGTLLMAGPVMDGSGRAFGVFWSRAAADEFIAGDPFITEGVVDKATVIEWREALE